VYFFAIDAAGGAVWATDGTSAGTVRIADVAPGVFLGSGNAVLQPLGNSLYFSARSGSALTLWKTDGTAAKLSDAPDLGGQIARGLVNGKLLVRVQAALSNAGDLWASDGTQAGSTRLAAMATNPYGGLVSSELITISGNKAYFVGQDDATGQELWVTDGTAAGTQMLKDINPAGDSKPYRVVSLGGGMAVFNVVDPVRGDQLWRTDGTSTGTVLISDVSPVAPAGTQFLQQEGVAQLAAAQHYFFVAEDPVLGNELFALADELPVAAADSGTSNSGAVASINVLANDTDSDGMLDNTTVKINTNPSHGTVVVSSSGVLNYTPTAGYAGTDTFAYTVSDNQGGTSAPATVTVTATAAPVSPPPVPPVTPGTGGKGGGGAMSLLELIALALFACSGWRRHAKRRPEPHSYFF
jgi:ELWxxDGT repeat protein